MCAASVWTPSKRNRELLAHMHALHPQFARFQGNKMMERLLNKQYDYW